MSEFPDLVVKKLILNHQTGFIETIAEKFSVMESAVVLVGGLKNPDTCVLRAGRDVREIGGEGNQWVTL